MLPKEEFDRILENTERVKKWVVAVFLAAVAFSFASAALGATYGLTDRSGNKLTLHDEPCSIPFLKGWKKASFFYEGKNLTACWMAARGLVYVLDDLGDLTPVPITAFTKLQEG
jgi:hypothetical protein